MMKIALFVGGGIIAIVVLIIVIGVLLPRDHVAARTLRVNAPIDTVWRTMTDVAAFPSWRADVRRVELLPAVDGRASWREHSKDGPIAMVVDSSAPPSKLVTRIADENLPFGGTWTYVLTPGATGTRVTITEHGSVYNPVFRFVSRFLLGHTGTIDAYLRALGHKFGSDDSPAAAEV